VNTVQRLLKDTYKLPWAYKLALGVWTFVGLLAAVNSLSLLGWFYGLVLGFHWAGLMYLALFREHAEVFMALYEDYQKLQLENETLKTKLGENHG